MKRLWFIPLLALALSVASAQATLSPVQVTLLSLPQEALTPPGSETVAIPFGAGGPPMVFTAQTALLSLPAPAEVSIANSEAQLVSINGAPYAGPAQVSGTVTLDLPTPGLYWVTVNVDGQVASFQLIRPAL